MVQTQEEDKEAQCGMPSVAALRRDVTRPVLYLASEYDAFNTGATLDINDINDINGGVYSA